jgi:hypothetical protein
MTAPDGPVSWRDHWGHLATAALLGTDRRRAPAPPPGPLADAVARLAPADDAESVLVQVALLSAARRAGLRPAEPVALLAPCPPDDRPPCPPAAAARLAELVEHWPSLVDEWLDRLIAGGYRLPPALAATLLARHRADARRPVVEEAAGPLAEWLTGLFPEAYGRPRSKLPAPAERPPLPADLAELLARPAPEIAATLAAGLVSGRLGVRLRAPLVHLVSLLRPSALGSVAEALSRAGTNPSTLGLALSLADLARVRAAMIAELRGAGPGPAADAGEPAAPPSPEVQP